MKILTTILTLFFGVFLLTDISAAQKTRFDFEDGLNGWDIPDWSFAHADYHPKSIGVSNKKASSGNYSIELVSDFPGVEWAATIVEYGRDLDLRGAKTISADIYVPRGAPKLLQARIILTVGIGWHYIESRDPVFLTPGRWTHVEVPLSFDGFAQEKAHWKSKTEEQGLMQNLNKVKKVSIRIEYDAAPPTRMGAPFNKPIYIDNVTIE